MFDKLRKFSQRITDSPPAEELPLSTICAKVVGTTFEGRQEKLEALSKLPLESIRVELKRDRGNPYDFYAVAVYAGIPGSLEQVGFLSKKMSKKIAGILDQGGLLKADPHKILGGYVSDQAVGEKLNFGFDILILKE